MNCYLFQYNYKHKKILFHSRERKNYSVLQAYTLSYLYPEEAKKKKKRKKNGTAASLTCFLLTHLLY